ncbi:recombinase family protein [Lysinibacillus fusiformis]|nr:recombinase family protein [Lysinibacillus fusiformis]
MDKASRKDIDRPQYQVLRVTIKEGDLIYMDDLDRLGRSYEDVIDEWKYIIRKLGADIVITSNAELFDNRKFKSMDDIGKLLEDQFLSMLAYVAEQEQTTPGGRDHNS